MKFKKIHLFILSAVIGLLLTSQGFSQTVRESFAYPTGGPTIIGMGGAQDGWADAWHLDPGDATVSDSLLWTASSDSINYGDMNYDTPHIGNLLYGSRGAVPYARYERTLSKLWTPDSGTVYWFSVIMDLENDTSSSTWAGIKLVQDHTDAAVMFGKGYGQDVYSCGGGYHASLDDPECSSVTWDAGPVWLVGEIFNMGLGNQGIYYMWISPDPTVQPDTSQADARALWSPNPGIQYVRVEYGGGIPFQMAVDEIRMGTSFADVSSDLVTPGHLAFESFAYPTGGATIIGMGGAQDGWADAWHLDPGDATVSDSLFWTADAGIDYGDMNYNTPHTGNLLYGSRGADKYARYERTLDKIWTPDSGTIYWFSAIMQLDNDTSSSTWAGIKVTPDHTDNAVMFGKGYGQDVYTCGGGYHGSLDAECSAVTWDAGPVWLVGEIFNMGLGNQSLYYMWISPDPTVQPDTSQADARSHWASDPGIQYVRVEYGGGVPFQMGVDEIRLGTTYTDIISDVAKELFGTPTNFKLSQNYPNPFNPATQIEYSIVKGGYTTLKVYNLLGQEVKTLIAGFQHAGNYRVTFDGSNLSSGVYFYRLETGNNSVTKKMILMK